MAAKAGGPTFATNPSLRLMIDKAKAGNIAKTITFDRAIKKADRVWRG